MPKVVGGVGMKRRERACMAAVAVGLFVLLVCGKMAQNVQGQFKGHLDSS